MKIMLKFLSSSKYFKNIEELKYFVNWNLLAEAVKTLITGLIFMKDSVKDLIAGTLKLLSL